MKRYRHIILPALALLFLGSCQFWDNFTTLFNTYYNMHRLMMEVEDEFEYLSEKERVMPRVVVPGTHTLVDITRPDREVPDFLEEFVISKAKLQPVKAKVDSIIVKGSKILAKHPKSDFIDGTLFLMAKAFFYQGEWVPSQIKCQELMERFPYSSYSPEVHLLLAKNLFMQRQYKRGDEVLSKTVDIAWGQENYRVLGEAFRLQAELSMYQEDLEGAVRPYRRAIAQAKGETTRARWQCDLALLLYRKERFEEALAEFKKVYDYSPDLLTRFETEMYIGATLAYLERFEESDPKWEPLEENSNYKEWHGYVYGERINHGRLAAIEGDSMKKMQFFGDSAFSNNPQIASAYYRMGLADFKEGDYRGSRKFFSRARGPRSPIKHIAARYVGLLTTWQDKHKFTKPLVTKILDKDEGDDSLRLTVASELFELGRIHEQLGVPDSGKHYYDLASRIAPKPFQQRAKYLFALERLTRPVDAIVADSLMEEIAELYALTEYGAVARATLGYTDEAVIDTVAELFTSAESFRRIGEFNNAISKYRKLTDEYPKSRFAARSLYAIGWTHERKLYNNQAALDTYKELIEKYPDSEYAKEVALSVEFAEASIAGADLDSMTTDKRGKPRAVRTEKGVTTPDKFVPASKKKRLEQQMNESPADVLMKRRNEQKEQEQKNKNTRRPPKQPISPDDVKIDTDLLPPDQTPQQQPQEQTTPKKDSAPQNNKKDKEE